MSIVRYKTQEGKIYNVESDQEQLFVEKFPGAVLMPKLETEKQASARKEKQMRKAMKIAYSVTPQGALLPKWAMPLQARLYGGSAGLVSGVLEAGEVIYENIKGMSKEEMLKDGLNPVSKALRDVEGFYDIFYTKQYDNAGNELRASDLYAKGDAASIAKGLNISLEQGIESLPTMIASYINPFWGGALMGISSMGTTFKDDLENRPDLSLAQLNKNAVWAGGAEWIGEYLGGTWFRSMNAFDPTGANKAVVKELTGQFIEKFIGRTFGSAFSEAASETITAVMQTAGNQYFYKDAKTTGDYIHNIVDAVVPALMLGGSAGAISSVSPIDRQEIYKYVSPAQWKDKALKIGHHIHETEKDLENANDKLRPKFKEKLKKLKEQQKAHEQKLFNAFNSMSNKQLNEYAETLDIVNKNVEIITSGDYSQAAIDQAKKDNYNLLKGNLLQLNLEGNFDVSFEQLVGEALKTSEIIENRLKKAKGINKSDLDIQILRTDEEINKAVKRIGTSAKTNDGIFIGKNENGKATIYINKQVASVAGATNVLGHELLHYMISRKFKTDNKSMQPLIDELKSYLKENYSEEYKQVSQRINNHYTDKQTGKIKSGALEEYLNVFSDLIDKKKIDLQENNSKGIVGGINDVMLGFGFGEVKLNSAEDVIKFLSTYNKNINRQGLLGKLMGVKMINVNLTSDVLTEGQDEKTSEKGSISTPLEAINSLLPGNITTQEDYYKVLNDPRIASDAGVERILDNKGKLAPVIEAYIRSRSTSSDMANENIKSVRKRLANFDPAETRADGSTVGQEGFGEFIFANARFGKLDAAKELAIKAEKEKKTTRLDDPDVKDIADKKTTKTQTKQGPKARVLKSLGNIHLDNKDVISSDIAVKIDNLIQENPSDLESKITALIEKEITIAVKAQMGKISKQKGKVVISEEYKAFLAFNYTDIIQGLDVATIKKNYNTLFELTEIGKEDRKTKKSDKPSLKKDSNYRKGIYKIETNKAKFTKFFTEGGYTTLLARQKGLANKIAEGIVKDVINDRVINESSNNNAIIKATLSKIANNLDRQKDEVKGNYNDQIKFSSSAQEQSNILVDRVKNSEFRDEVFDKNGKPLKGYIVGKTEYPFLEEVYEPIFELVENDILIPEKTKNKLLEKVLKKYQNKDDNQVGDAVERWYYNGFEKSGLLMDGFVLGEDNVVIEPLIEAGFEGGVFQRADIMFKVDDYRNAALELKAFGLTKLGHNKPFSKNPKKPEYRYTKNGFELNPNNPKEINDKLKESFNAVAVQAEKLSKYLKKEFNIDWKSRKDFIPFVKDGRKVYYDKKVMALKAAANNKDVKVGGDFVAAHYNKKGVYYIQIADLGMFYLGSDPLGLAEILGITKFEGNFDLQGRLLASKVKKDGKKVGYALSIDSEAILDPRNVTNKTGFSLDDPGAFAKLKKALKESGAVYSKDVAKVKKLHNAVKASRTVSDPKGITVLDFDDTLATTKSLVKFTTPEGKTGTLNAEEYASTYEDLLDKGYVFDFSDFNKVVKGKLAPLFNKAIKLQGKFGPENMFVLTARPPQAQKAIFDFLKANGLNIPLKNITGLGNSTSEAKALWVAEKVGEGFNDFYFADDALQNVQAVKNMLDQFDVKSKVQQAKVKFSNSLDTEFNDILENVTGIESFKRFERTKARKRGADKGKFRLFIPPSHEDFVGLLYNFMGKGGQGDAHRNFFEQALVRPLNRAYKEVDTAKQAVANDYKALNKQMPEVNKMLSKKTPDGDFTYQDAIRVYLWDKHGYKIPGLSPVDQKNLVDLVKSDGSLQSYAETLNVISKQEAYVDPGQNWETGNIRIDLVDATGRVGRASYFAEFQENADIIFSEENLNKIEAAYGTAFREALEDMLHRIKTGVNRPKGSSAKPNIFMNWLNASVAGVMFLNVRSSLLQQMSNVNYLNFADNNIFAAGLAFANQPQYWKDFAMIFNSDMLKQRRGGLQTDINGAELAEAIKKARPGNLFDQVAIIVGKALRLGFLPTQIGDNIAIATGGAAFYRNRVNKYIKDGLSKKEAEAKAFTDFQNITQSTQQSARPDMTSQQQSSWIGKLILNFLNTPSQYNRIIKKAGSDILNKRITPPNTSLMQSNMSNASRILYYGAAQNLIFYSLQTALFAVMFGDEDEDEEKRVEQYLKKKERVIQGTIDTILRGSGIYGVAVSTLKNMAIKFMEQREKGYNPDESAVIMEMLNFSPVVGIKARRIVNAEKTLNYNKKVIEEMETLDIDNPLWSAVTNYTQTITTAPVNKIYQKIINLRNAADNDYTVLQRLLFFTGYTTWSLNLGDTKKMKEIKEKVKSKSKSKKGKPRLKGYKLDF